MKKHAGDIRLNHLTTQEERVIVNRGTEFPFTGEYDNFFERGTYICRRCNAKLYKSERKFNAHCGWPAFDEAIRGAVKVHEPANLLGGYEIECAHCAAHLGHIFKGEGFTKTNVRHCVNSISMRFVPEQNRKKKK